MQELVYQIRYYENSTAWHDVGFSAYTERPEKDRRILYTTPPAQTAPVQKQVLGFEVVLDESLPPNTMKFVQPVGQEPVIWPTVDEFAKQIRWLNGSYKKGACSLAEHLLEWLKSKTFIPPPPSAAAPAQHEQKPVSKIQLPDCFFKKSLEKDNEGFWSLRNNGDHIRYLSKYEMEFVESALAANPPAQRKWVDLTPEDRQKIRFQFNEVEQIQINTEAKLKEKNT